MNSRWSRFAPLLGVVFVVLFAVSTALSGSEPDAHASTAKVLSYYTSNVTRHNASYYLSGIAIVAGLLFYALLWEHLRLAERSPRLATAAFGGAVLFAGGGAIGVGSDLALTNAPAGITAATAQTLNLLGNYLSAAAIATGVVVLLASAGVAILHGRRLPVWIGWLAIVLAAVTLIPVPNLGVLPAGLWTLIVSLVLYLRPAITLAQDQHAASPELSVTS
jgi:hypothetical protein